MTQDKMDIRPTRKAIVYIMSSKRSVPLPTRNNKPWTVTETRDLIRMCRHEDNSVENMAFRLGRTPESIRYHLLKLFAEHMEGREPTDENIQDVSDWLVAAGN